MVNLQGTFNNLFVLGVVISTHLHVVAAQGVFDVTDPKYGAVGDGKKDDTQAFTKAWADTCAATAGIPKLVVPEGKTFFVGPTSFMGPCKAKNVTFELGGTIVAPENPAAWNSAKGGPGTWLVFNGVTSLLVNGGGVIDGRRKGWWEKSCSNTKRLGAPGCTKTQPAAINFWGTSGGQFRDITVQNSGMFHVTLLKLEGFEAYNIKINSPEDSPNTDGIHLQDVKQVTIADSQFRGGDDCVSIGDRSSFVYVRNCHCGPGHGVSIGSLGKNGAQADVEEIHVEKIEFVGTMFGARIKTYQGGKGYCRKISYKNSNFTNVMNPIFIDQFYWSTNKNEVGSAVSISDVTFEGLTGTTDVKTPTAISLSCSKLIPCSGIKISNVNLTPAVAGTKLTSNCSNAKGTILGKVEPAVTSLISSA
ncbi:polygalacturonase-like [Papaver somniferum]|uniref:polygalacturonase-like n=1 Tax=Papaver somniferum TaxID=3469 RepID=UPI000E6F4E93|nr:polygalacturonase-like [Papaver somniferum]